MNKKIVIFGSLWLLGVATGLADVALYRKESGDLLTGNDGKAIVLRGDVEITEDTVRSKQHVWRGIKRDVLGVVRAQSISGDTTNIADISDKEIVDIDAEQSDIEHKLNKVEKAAVKELAAEIESCKQSIRQLSLIIKNIHPAAESQCDAVRDAVPSLSVSEWRQRIADAVDN